MRGTSRSETFAAGGHHRERTDDQSGAVDGFRGDEPGNAVVTQGADTGPSHERVERIQSSVGNGRMAGQAAGTDGDAWVTLSVACFLIWCEMECGNFLPGPVTLLGPNYALITRGPDPD